MVFLLYQWLSSCGLLTPGGLWAALRRPIKGNRRKKIHFCCIQLSTRCCFPRGCISPRLRPKLGTATVDSEKRGGEQTLQQQRREV